MLKARSTALTLVCCFISLHSAASLRTVPARDEPSETASPKIPKDAAGQVGYLGRLPNLTEFERVWEKRYRSEHRLKEPMPPGVKLVLGIQAVPWQTEFRNVLRRTWLNQTGVCLLGAGPPPSDCSVHVAFVFGSFGQGNRIPEDADLSPSNEAAAREEPGAFVLKGVKEMMNHGKVFEWFRVAAEAFPWATHIAKGDMDMYPFLHKLVGRMSDRACRGPTPYEYAGRAYACPKDNDCHGSNGGQFRSSCPPHRCEKVYDSDEERSEGGLVRHHGQPFAYMGGPLYIMSRKLAEAMVRPDGWYAGHTFGGHEDMKASVAIDFAAALEGFCVSTWSPDAYYHVGEQASEDYANSF